MKALAILVVSLWAMLEAADVPNEWEIPDTIPATTVYRPPATTSTTTTTEPVPTVTTADVVWVETTTTVPSWIGYRCAEWAPLALEAGWPEERLELLLDDIAWDESRCQPDAVSPTNDYGLLQINWATWSTYVQSFGLTKHDLLVPSVNLWIGLQIAEMADDAGWGWCQPWHMSEVRRCSSN